MSSATEEVYRALKEGFRGDLIRPGDAEYEKAWGIWNAMVARKPGLIARCADVSDVQGAVRSAAATGVLTAVRCGGHSLAGFSACDDGLVIELSRMRQVYVDSDARRAWFAGGCLLGSIDTATQKTGLVFPAGVVSHTGASGLILGGGFGWLTRRFGLSCDNVEGFQVVTADGTTVHANSKDNADLYWALRGGGGNFGVVTQFQVRLHPLKSVLLGEGMCLGDDVPRLLQYWRDFMPEAPEDFKWNLSLRLAMHTENVPEHLRGRPVLSQSLLWTGDPEVGRRCLDRGLSMCNPVAVTQKEMSFLALQTMADDEFPHGRRYYTKSGYFRRLDDASIGHMVDALATIPSPLTQIELAYLGGAAGRVDAGETAFGDRGLPFVVNLLGNWSEAAEDAANVAWVRDVFKVLRPAMTPGVYVNFMSGDEDDRVPEAYHDRWQRLVAIKSHYDPGNLFRLNQNIRPRRTASQ
ncbi:MAG TPA: FAD-binding oxidoreductase [Acidobacteriota bacterium]|nr:FAD-binding oxidoreductase [Acidobacteriota bacterium]